MRASLADTTPWETGRLASTPLCPPRGPAPLHTSAPARDSRGGWAPTCPVEVAEERPPTRPWAGRFRSGHRAGLVEGPSPPQLDRPCRTPALQERVGRQELEWGSLTPGHAGLAAPPSGGWAPQPPWERLPGSPGDGCGHHLLRLHRQAGRCPWLPSPPRDPPRLPTHPAERQRPEVSGEERKGRPSSETVEKENLVRTCLPGD